MYYSPEKILIRMSLVIVLGLLVILSVSKLAERSSAVSPSSFVTNSPTQMPPTYVSVSPYPAP